MDNLQQLNTVTMDTTPKIAPTRKLPKNPPIIKPSGFSHFSADMDNKKLFTSFASLTKSSNFKGYQQFIQMQISLLNFITKVKVIMNINRIIYRIAGNFGEVFNLANWRFYGRSPNLKSAIFYSDGI